MLKKPELMAPAGDMTMLNTAINAGADAVYFGVDLLNMRMKAENFTINELDEIAAICSSKNVLSYLVVNSIVYEEEVNQADELICEAKRAGIDRIICWDFSVINLCKKHDIPFCISTQASISNSASANFYKQLGAVRVVLARECSLKDIKAIRQNCDVEIEAFVHGAMCIAVSGRCFMSHHLFGQSANRGECVQPCRREFEVKDNITHKSLILGEDYVMSPKDLCTIEFVDQLIEAGIDSFKIEGRKRSPEYVHTTISAYRKAIDLYFEGKLTKEIKKELLAELEEVYNRGFSPGFYFDIPSGNEYADIYGSKAKTRKEYIGKVINYYKQPKVAYILLESGVLKKGDDIFIIGPTTGTLPVKVENIMNEEIELEQADKGLKITFPCETLVRPNDAVYLKIKNIPVEK